MSDLAALVAILFLVCIFALGGLWTTRMAHEFAMRIVTGIAHGMPLSPKSREGILFHVWLPTQMGTVLIVAFGALGFLEMANHVDGAGVRQLAQLAAFLLACNSAFVFVSAIFGVFQYRAKIRRDQQQT